MLDFRNYIHKLAEVIVNELYVSQEARMYPYHELTQDYASYIVDDVYLELYLYSEEHLVHKHPRYKQAVL